MIKWVKGAAATIVQVRLVAVKLLCGRSFSVTQIPRTSSRTLRILPSGHPAVFSTSTAENTGNTVTVLALQVIQIFGGTAVTLPMYTCYDPWTGTSNGRLEVGCDPALTDLKRDPSSADTWNIGWHYADCGLAWLTLTRVLSAGSRFPFLQRSRRPLGALDFRL